MEYISADDDLSATKKPMTKYLVLLFLGAIALCWHPIPTQAQNTITEICPDIPLQNRWEGF
ncbi:MAG TPA: hypothetical protein PLZ51_25180, partial [Aggregatilineales bacterium]|nr:hypothetical protein [Aggregatilineales bacterium]